MAQELKFDQKIADEICEEISLGKSLRSILADKKMPAMSTVFKWLSLVPEFAEQYAYAREVQGDYLFDDLLELADTATPENAQAIRLRVETRKWAASKLKPKKYGDKADLNIKAETKNEHTIRELPATDDWIEGIVGSGAQASPAKSGEE